MNDADFERGLERRQHKQDDLYEREVSEYERLQVLLEREDTEDEEEEELE